MKKDTDFAEMHKNGEMPVDVLELEAPDSAESCKTSAANDDGKPKRKREPTQVDVLRNRPNSPP